MKKKFFILFVSIWLAGCGHAASIIPIKELVFPSANYGSLVMVNQEIIAFVTNEDPIKDPQKYAKQRDSNLDQIYLPRDSRCTGRIGTYIVDTFPDDRLQLLEHCYDDGKLPAIITLRAYDFLSGEIEQIAKPLPLGTSEVSWNPDQTRGIVFLDSGFTRGTLYWIWKDGFGPLDLVITDRDRSWNLKDDFPDFKADDSGKTGTTGRAAWSPNGNNIAFFASSDAIGKTGSAGFYVEYNLYLMDVNQLKPKPILNNVYFPFIIKWSPDSEYLAFISQYGFLKQDGIWLYSFGDNSTVNIAKGKFQDILWNGNGNSLIAIHCDDDLYCSQIEEYDLTSIVRP